LDDKLKNKEADIKFIDETKATAVKRSPHTPHTAVFFDCVKEGLLHGGIRGISKEVESITSLLDTPSTRSLLHVFFAQRATANVPGLKADGKIKAIKRVAVLGGGTMGSGIAALCLLRVTHSFIQLHIKSGNIQLV
jgi:enoyl-CoA hydratase/3-hydroxyacyl-CoA dehydrogenase